MALTEFLPWAMALLLVGVHYFGEHIAGHRHRDTLASFAVGVTVTYVFLQLLPEHHEGIEYLGNFGFFSVLISFAALHAIEKFIYQHEKSVEEIRHDFKELHTVFFVLYYGAIGLLLHFLVGESVLEGVLFFVPVFLHTSITSFSPTDLHEAVLENSWVRGAVMLAAPLGVGIGALVGLGPVTAHIVLGVITGMFLYLVISESIGQKERGNVLVFLLGVGLYSLIIVGTWTLG